MHRVTCALSYLCVELLVSGVTCALSYLCVELLVC